MKTGVSERETYSGKLKEGTLKKLLKKAKENRQSGRLYIKSHDGFGVITINDGNITSATTPLQKKKMTEEILKRGIITEQELQIIMKKHEKNPAMHLEKFLVDEGSLSQDTLFEILKGLGGDALLSMLFWEGIYRFKRSKEVNVSAKPIVDIDDLIKELNESIDGLDSEIESIFDNVGSSSLEKQQEDIDETLTKVAKSLTTFSPREIVIVVDDEKLIRHMIADGLTDFGFEVEAYDNAKDGLERIEKMDMERISPVIVLDLLMSGLYDENDLYGGIDLLENISRYHPEIPVIITTGSDDYELKLETSFLGASYFIQKPSDPTLGSEENYSVFGKFIEELSFNIENIYNKRQAFLEKEQLASVREELLRQMIKKGSVSFKNESDILNAKILFVDDEEEIRKVSKEFIMDEGFRDVDFARDGEEGIELFTKKKHDIVITDIVMPKKNGIEVLKYVKILSPNSQVVIITGHADKDSAVAALKLGAYHFIEKPIDFAEMIKVMRQAVELKLLFDQKM